ncbi:hypothetical protein QLH52_05315 [Methylomonas sp. OY6]|uniref:Uncharacterized protein n=1 Tax=Methylomonas defluvii TaxID=3045149 RepID=A0ABU4UBE9_9GAMM|nr:hypothetical protein [Methylomonas sp. OY6]
MSEEKTALAGFDRIGLWHMTQFNCLSALPVVKACSLHTLAFFFKANCRGVGTMLALSKTLARVVVLSIPKTTVSP